MQQQTDNETRLRETGTIRELLSLDERAKIEFTDFGWTSRVYIINDGEIVFKFPRAEAIKEEYAREISAYRLARKVAGGDVLVPDVSWEHPDRDYLGYRGIVGQPVDQILSRLTRRQIEHIGARLGAFLGRLHSLEMPEASLRRPEAEFDEYAYKFELGLPCIETHFTGTEVARIKALILETYPTIMTRAGFEPGLCHGDLGLWNLILGPDGELGVIDFGDVGYHDISIDFAGMTDGAMLKAALDAYGGNVPAEKIALRMKAMPVIDLPFFLGKEDEAGIAVTVERIRTVTLA